MRIGISGYFGYHNFGDELFLKTFKQIFDKHEIQALTAYDDINSYDRIIVGGGDIVIPNLFSNAFWRPEFFDKPTYIYGVGVAINLINDEKELKKYTSFFSKCRKVCVRDIGSCNWLIENGIYANSQVVEDIVWSYKIPEFKYKNIRNNRPLVGISVRPNRSFDWMNIVNLGCHIAKECDIIMIPLHPAFFQHWRDDDIHEVLKNDILKHVPNANINIVPLDFDLEHRLKFIESVDLYVTERFHGMLMSLRVNTPVMTIANEKAFLPNKFLRLSEKFGLQHTVVNNSLKNMIDIFDKIKNSIIRFDILKDDIKRNEQKAMNEILEFKNIVLKGD